MDRGANVEERQDRYLYPVEAMRAHRALADIAETVGLSSQSYLTALEREGPCIWRRLAQPEGTP